MPRSALAIQRDAGDAVHVATKHEKQLATHRAKTRDARAETTAALVQIPVGVAATTGLMMVVPEVASKGVAAGAVGALVISAFKRYEFRPLVVGASVGLLVPHAQAAIAGLITKLRSHNQQTG